MGVVCILCTHTHAHALTRVEDLLIERVFFAFGGNNHNMPKGTGV